MDLIPDIRQDVLDRSIARASERDILLPTIAQQKDPSLVPAQIRARLKEVGLWMSTRPTCFASRGKTSRRPTAGGSMTATGSSFRRP